MNKTCGNCGNYDLERMCHTDVCSECFKVGTNGKIIGNPSKWKPKPKTNADHIRSMTDEELAVFLSRREAPCDCCQLQDNDAACTEILCDNAALNWLKQPYKEKEE